MSTVSLRINVIANYLGQGWRVLMGLAFVPLYIEYLGMETYGLIGVFAMLQAWLTLLDFGIRPALAREMACFKGGAHSPESIKDLLRSVEVIGFCSAITIAIGVWLASGWLARDWLNAENLPVGIVAQAVALMGLVAAFSFVENIYISSLVGLQRQVQQNIVSVVVVTAKGLGAVFVLAWVSSTAIAFFLWHAVISLVGMSLTAMVVYRSLPATSRSARFSRRSLFGIWKFAGGMMGITLLSLFLMQVDKVVLSRFLSLEDFGYYAFAGLVSSSLVMLVGPLDSAFYPRFTELVTRNDASGICESYHLGAQLVTVLMGSAGVVLIAFGEQILYFWTGDGVLASRVAPLTAILALGTMFNGLMHMPYQLQLAHGWTSLTIKVNVVAVLIVVPLILIIAPRYGALGVAWIWVALNACYIIFSISLMHRRLMPAEKWRWYGQDVALPLVAAVGTAWLFNYLMREFEGVLSELYFIAGGVVSVVVVSAVSANRVREKLTSLGSLLAKRLAKGH